jgi:hypothetical protein
MSYFVYKSDKPRTYKGYTIRPDKKSGKWSVSKGGYVSFQRGTLASVKRALKRRRR